MQSAKLTDDKATKAAMRAFAAAVVEVRRSQTLSTAATPPLTPEECAILRLAILAQQLIVQDEQAALAVLQTAYTNGGCGPLP